MATVRLPSYFPQRINSRVDKMAYVDNIEGEGAKSIEYGVVAPLNATGILAAQSIAVLGATSTFNAALTQNDATMTRWGRNVTVVASGAATSAVRVKGRDFLGQLMREDFVLNGTTPVAGKKAFRYIDSVEYDATAATTINVGYGNILGLPYKLTDMMYEIKNQAKAANAGTFVAGLANGAAATATNADVRGTYLPVTVIPDGTNTFEIRGFVDKVNVHGNKQYFAA